MEGRHKNFKDLMLSILRENMEHQVFLNTLYMYFVNVSVLSTQMNCQNIGAGCIYQNFLGKQYDFIFDCEQEHEGCEEGDIFKASLNLYGWHHIMLICVTTCGLSLYTFSDNWGWN